MTTEQARLDSKKRTITVPVQTEAGNKGKLKESDERGWFTKKNLWTILLIVAGLAVLYFTKYEEWKIPSLKSAVYWCQNNWLSVFILSGILAALISIFGSGKVKNTLLSLLIGIQIMVFIVFSPYFWVAEPTKIAKQPEIPLTSMDVSEWPKLTIPAKGKSGHIPVPPGMRMAVNGSRIRVHTMYSDGQECVSASEGSGQSCPNGIVTGTYVTNEANETNIVSYAYEKI